MYALFCGTDHNEYGGWHDLKATHTNLQTLKATLIEDYDWAHIVNLETEKMIAFKRRDDIRYGTPHLLGDVWYDEDTLEFKAWS